ncbi:hypothetical protein BD309DRAFT_863125 [Dichomitus squalens]|uniref:Uncharacterized protein n=1 Tax=Dichomitus squalens TaxID=114155 RepID=A0A4Q9NVI2_9APHY|nr:hypothetical protein BD309DRAFT_863125 [Dichomitus squalens]TBU54462.1 hypothetical protein BD310DRAFT_827907 [Dichomitus squalens]
MAPTRKSGSKRRTIGFYCDLCEKSFAGDQARHSRRHAPNKDDLKWRCALCKVADLQKHNVVQHIARAHLRDSRYHCSWCEEKFSCSSNLSKHKHIAHGYDSNSHAGPSSHAGLLEDCEEHLRAPSCYQQTASRVEFEPTEAKPKLFESCANRVLTENPIKLDHAEPFFEPEVFAKRGGSVKREWLVEYDPYAYVKRKLSTKDELRTANIPFIKQQLDVHAKQPIEQAASSARVKQTQVRHLKPEPYDIEPRQPNKQGSVATRIKREASEPYGFSSSSISPIPPQPYPHTSSIHRNTIRAVDAGASQTLHGAYVPQSLGPIVKNELMDVDVKPPSFLKPSHVQPQGNTVGAQQPLHPAGVHPAQLSRSHSTHMRAPGRPNVLRAYATW